ncbi:MAG: MFS transporter [Candidatus Thorarchaeota archaeon]|nr:MFS transporter [Candidatus Thorarchaeota archaeon]
MTLLARLFGLENATESGLRLAKIMAVVLPLFAATFQISTTFWIIFISESLGSGNYLDGLVFVGVLTVIQFGVQVLLDYPTGALGDHIGQRYVISSALLCYAVAFWLTATLTFDTPFFVYVVIFALMGLGSSQESGAFHAWFDNNYRVVMPEDKDRKQYGVFWGKVGMLWQVSSLAVILPGSILATIFFRETVFIIQALSCVGLAIVVMIVIKDLPGARDETEPRSVQQYGGLLKDGVKFLFSSRFVALLLLGEVVIWSMGTVWWNIVLFPLYFAYLFNDIAVSSYRTLVFVPEAVAQERSGIWAKRFDPVKWTPRFRFLQFLGFGFNIVIALIIFAFSPPLDAANMVGLFIPFTDIAIIEMPGASVAPMVLIFILFIITDAFGSLAGILTQRVMLDVVPNKIRNSVYSLQPTLTLLLAMPFVAFFGWLLPLHGFPVTFGLMSIVALVGTIMIVAGFRNPIPKIETIAPATQEAIEIVGEMEAT